MPEAHLLLIIMIVLMLYTYVNILNQLVVINCLSKTDKTFYSLGTGSGSLSHAMLRTIAPNGHLKTFDFHDQRVQKAREEFQHHGFGDLVTISQRDVCTDGFGLSFEVDAVFLDLPGPWTAIASAKLSIKHQGAFVEHFCEEFCFRFCFLFLL